MEIKQLITFYTVAKTLNFSQAAIHLNYAQPTISTHIQSLEQELNVPLFDRLGKRIALTAAGERLFDYAEHMIRIEGEARTMVSQSGAEPEGDLRIHASGSMLGYHLPPVFRKFKSSYPLVNLIVAPPSIENFVDAVINGDTDIAIVYRQELPDTVDYIKLFIEPMWLVCAPDHPLASELDITPTSSEPTSGLSNDAYLPIKIPV